jgi:hypothetical protein
LAGAPKPLKKDGDRNLVVDAAWLEPVSTIVEPSRSLAETPLMLDLEKIEK